MQIVQPFAPTVALWVRPTAIKHPVPDRVKRVFVIFSTSGHSDAQS